MTLREALFITLVYACIAFLLSGVAFAAIIFWSLI